MATNSLLADHVSVHTAVAICCYEDLHDSHSLQSKMCTNPQVREGPDNLKCLLMESILVERAEANSTSLYIY